MDQTSESPLAKDVLEKARKTAESITSIHFISRIRQEGGQKATSELETVVEGDAVSVRYSLRLSDRTDAKPFTGQFLNYRGAAYARSTEEEPWMRVGTPETASSSRSWVDVPSRQGLTQALTTPRLIYGFTFDDLHEPRLSDEPSDTDEFFHIRANLDASIPEAEENQSTELRIVGTADLWISRDKFHVHRAVWRRLISGDDTYRDTIESDYSLFNEAVIENLPKP